MPEFGDRGKVENFRVPTSFSSAADRANGLSSMEVSPATLYLQAVLDRLGREFAPQISG